MCWQTKATADWLLAVAAGKSAPTVDSPQYVEFEVLTYVYSLLYWSVITFASISILLLYRRIFSTQQFFSKASSVLISLTLMWWISGTICEAAGFRPVQGYWDTSVEGRYYLNYDAFWLTNMITELFLEVIILILPIRELTKVHLENGKKILIACMFLMGTFVLATGIVRIHYVWSGANMTPGVIWLSVHSSCAIISACLPTFGPLLKRVPGLKHITHRRISYTLNNTRSQSTRRTIPRAFDNFRTSTKVGKGSFDGILLDQQSDRATSDDSHLQNGLNSHHQDTEFKQSQSTGDPSEVQYGLTKKISVPSPGPEEEFKTHSLIHGSEGSPAKYPLAPQGSQTKRADLEFSAHQNARGQRERREP